MELKPSFSPPSPSSKAATTLLPPLCQTEQVEWGLQSVNTFCYFLSFPLLHPAQILSTKSNSSRTDCSSLSPPWAAVLPENLLPLWASLGCSSCHQPTPEWALHRLQLPAGHIYLLQCGVLHSLQGGDLPPVILQQAAGDSFHHHVFSGAAGESLLWHTKRLLVPPSSLILVACRAVSPTVFYSLPSQMQHSNFYPKPDITDLHPHVWWA